MSNNQNENKKLNEEFIVKPLPDPEVSIDTDNSFIKNIVKAELEQKNFGDLDKLTTISTRKDQLYKQLDTMCADPIISAILTSYVMDTLNLDDSGNYIRVESSDSKIEKYITLLLKILRVDNHLNKVVTLMYKYGDVFIRLYKNSEVNSYFDIISGNNNRNNLKESLKINISDHQDKFSNNIEVCSDPSLYFGLKKFGKTVAFIQAREPSKLSEHGYEDGSVYNFNSNDINLFEPNRFVHAIQLSPNQRAQNVVTISRKGPDGEDKEFTYEVELGKSIFTDAYPIWKKVNLLQDTLLLNRITRSSLTKVINIEVGDLPKEDAYVYVQHIKSLFQQKQSLGTEQGISEYNSPGAIENIIYAPVNDGKGAISFTNEGGEYNVTGIPDIDYFDDLLFGSFGVAKQYFGRTGDSAGFDGGGAIARQSIRYAKNIIATQAKVIKLFEDIVNIYLLDRGMGHYIGKFTLKMIPPVNIEEVESNEMITNRIDVIRSLVDLLPGISDHKKLLIIRELLDGVTQNKNISNIIMEEANRMEKEENAENEDTEDNNPLDMEDFGSNLGDLPGNEFEFDLSNEDDFELPTPEDLGQDFTINEEE